MITPLRFALACRGYAEIVDRQIAAADVREIAAAATRGATKREEIVDRLLARVEANVHYAGVEVSDGSIVPRLPTGVLKNKYVDCKDKATLLVALLRAAGLPAHVALLFAGHGFEVRTHCRGGDDIAVAHAGGDVDGEPLRRDADIHAPRGGEGTRRRNHDRDGRRGG